MTVLSLCRACTRGIVRECAGGDCARARGEHLDRRARWLADMGGVLIVSALVALAWAVFR